MVVVVVGLRVVVFCGRVVGRGGPGWLALVLRRRCVAAATRYRAWGAWRFFVSATIIGVLVAVVVFFAADLARFAPWAQVLYIVLSILGPVAWTAVGLGIGAALRRAGVSRAPR